VALLQQEIARDPSKWAYPEVSFGTDLQTEHERWLAEQHFHSCVFVHNYPRGIKAFYMRDNQDGRTVDAFDLIVPGVGELIGGSQREERLEVLQAKMRELGLDQEEYAWYLDLRRFGTVPHSGYGLGFERLVCYVTGVENIREAIAFPRFPGNAEF
jgi:asparaginyl-tRNA synthetase